MIHGAGLPAPHGVGSDLGGSGDRHLRRHDRSGTHCNVVPDMNQVVQFHVCPQLSVSDRAAVHTTVGTNLHVVTDDACADMRNAGQTPFRVGVPKPIHPYAYACV